MGIVQVGGESGLLSRACEVVEPSRTATPRPPRHTRAPHAPAATLGDDRTRCANTAVLAQHPPSPLLLIPPSPVAGSPYLSLLEILPNFFLIFSPSCGGSTEVSHEKDHLEAERSVVVLNA